MFLIFAALIESGIGNDQLRRMRDPVHRRLVIRAIDCFDWRIASSLAKSCIAS